MDAKENTEYEQIIVLANLIEANLMEALLKDSGLPFYLREWTDVNYGEIFSEQKGWGWVMGRSEDKDAIQTLYNQGVRGQDS